MNGVLAMKVAETLQERLADLPEDESYEKGFIAGVEWLLDHMKTEKE